MIDERGMNNSGLNINKKEKYSSYSLRQSWFINSILGKLSIKNCYFEGIQDLFYHGDSILLKHSYVNLIADDWFNSLFKCENMEISDTTICEKEKNEDISHTMFDIETYLRIETCHFIDCSHLYC